MAYAMNAIDWYRGNRPGMIGFGSFAAWDGPDTLPPGGTLRDGDCMVSNNRYFAACLSGGNLYIHRRNDPALSLVKVIGGSGRASYVVLQSDQNLVAYDAANKAVWSSGTYHKGAQRLVMQDDGNLVLYTSSNKAVWASNTSGAAAYQPPAPPPGPTQAEIDAQRRREEDEAARKRQEDAEAETRRKEEEARRQRAIADKAQENKLQADRDAATAKLAADQALIDASRNAADLQKQIDAQAALDKLAAMEREKAAADLAAAKAEAAAYEASLKAEQAGASSTSTVLTGQSLAPPPMAPSGPSPFLYVALAGLGALFFLKKSKKG